MIKNNVFIITFVLNKVIVIKESNFSVTAVNRDRSSTPSIGGERYNVSTSFTVTLRAEHLGQHPFKTILALPPLPTSWPEQIIHVKWHGIILLTIFKQLQFHLVRTSVSVGTSCVLWFSFVQTSVRGSWAEPGKKDLLTHKHSLYSQILIFPCVCEASKGSFSITAKRGIM